MSSKSGDMQSVNRLLFAGSLDQHNKWLIVKLCKY